MQEILLIHPDDNVVIALQELLKGQYLAIKDGLEAIEAVAQYHKIAICPIAKGEVVRKYGQIIGRASKNIRAGEHVHSHNLTTQLGGADSTLYCYSKEARQQVQLD